MEQSIRSTKQCARCREMKPIKGFSRDPSRRDGRYHTCKACIAIKDRQRIYGIRDAEYQALFLAQGGLCALCSDAPEEGRSKGLHVDHCHDSGKVRGLLCRKCNIGMGNFRDDPDLLDQAAAYVRFHEREG